VSGIVRREQVAIAKLTCIDKATKPVSRARVLEKRPTRTPIPNPTVYMSLRPIGGRVVKATNLQHFHWRAGERYLVRYPEKVVGVEADQ
jgi:hypothetical protein